MVPQEKKYLTGASVTIKGSEIANITGINCHTGNTG